jgi:hypothetical protein
MTDKLIVNESNENLIVEEAVEVIKINETNEKLIVSDSQEKIVVNEIVEKIVINDSGLGGVGGVGGGSGSFRLPLRIPAERLVERITVVTPPTEVEALIDITDDRGKFSPHPVNEAIHNFGVLYGADSNKIDAAEAMRLYSQASGKDLYHANYDPADPAHPRNYIEVFNSNPWRKSSSLSFLMTIKNTEWLVVPSISRSPDELEQCNLSQIVTEGSWFDASSSAYYCRPFKFKWYPWEFEGGIFDIYQDPPTPDDPYPRSYYPEWSFDGLAGTRIFRGPKPGITWDAFYLDQAGISANSPIKPAIENGVSIRGWNVTVDWDPIDRVNNAFYGFMNISSVGKAYEQNKTYRFSFKLELPKHTNHPNDEALYYQSFNTSCPSGDFAYNPANNSSNTGVRPVRIKLFRRRDITSSFPPLTTLADEIPTTGATFGPNNEFEIISHNLDGKLLNYYQHVKNYQFQDIVREEFEIIFRTNSNATPDPVSGLVWGLPALVGIGSDMVNEFGNSINCQPIAPPFINIGDFKMEVLGTVVTGGSSSSSEVFGVKASRILEWEPTFKNLLDVPRTITSDWNIPGYVKNEDLTPLLLAKAEVIHTHSESQITDLNKYTREEVDSFLLGKAPVGHTHERSEFGFLDTLENTLREEFLNHTHTEDQITNLDKYTKEEINSFLLGKAASAHTHERSEFSFLDNIENTLRSELRSYSDSGDSSLLTLINNLSTDTANSLAGKATLEANDFIGNQSITGDIEILSVAPRITFTDISTGAHSFDLFGDNNNFYIGSDTSNDGVNDVIALRLQNSSGEGYLYGNKLQTDANSYNNSAIDTLLSGKANTEHTHLWSHITDRPTALSAFTKDINFDERYYTESEIDQIISTVQSSPGLPTGGGIGQLIRKKSTTDFDTEWFTPNYAEVDQVITPIDDIHGTEMSDFKLNFANWDNAGGAVPKAITFYMENYGNSFPNQGDGKRYALVAGSTVVGATHWFMGAITTKAMYISGRLLVDGEIREQGTFLSDKYAAKSHIHANNYTKAEIDTMLSYKANMSDQYVVVAQYSFNQFSIN